MNLNIGKRLSLGFAAIAGILLIAVVITRPKVSAIDATGQGSANLRIPTAAASSKMVTNINGSLAAGGLSEYADSLRNDVRQYLEDVKSA